MIRFNVFALLAVVALQACSGGSSSPAPASAVSPAASSTPAAKPKTSVLLTITIPKAHGGAASRHPEYISTNTQSLVVAQLAASAPYKKTGNTVTTNVTPSSPGCSSGANGTTCVVAFAATAGTCIPQAVIATAKPISLRVTVFPPMFGPDTMRMR